MTDTERITARIPSEMMEKLQSLVDSGYYGSVSEVVTLALEDYIARNPSGPPKNKMTEIDLQALTDDEPDMFEEAIQNAVRDYIRKNIK